MQTSNLLPICLRRQNLKQVISNQWEDRHQITQKNVNLFCWQRLIPEPTTNFLKGCIEKQKAPLKVTVESKNLGEKLSQARREWDEAKLKEADYFWKDVYKLAKDFLKFSEVNKGILHLRIVNDDSCTKFHTDGYFLRLFTSYYGPGTEWLPENACRRSALGTSNEKIVRDPQQIRQMQTGTVGILKGELRGFKSVNKGIIHRSPAIKHKNLKRVVLRIDI